MRCIGRIPHDLAIVRQAAIVRATLTSGERIAGHLRVVHALFAEVAGATLAAALVVAVEYWGRDGCTGDLGAIVAESVTLVRSGLAPLSG
jgi:hypothetical protein